MSTEVLLNAEQSKKIKLDKEAGAFNHVELHPIEFAGQHTGNHVVIHLDDGRKAPVAQVGTSYSLVPNARAKEIGDEIMSQSSMSWDPKSTVWTGKRFINTFMSEEAAFELPEVGDVVKYGFRIENSYDGTSKLRAAVMAYVLSCTNGMVSDRLWGAFSIKHNDAATDFDLDGAMQRLIQGTNNLLKFKDTFREMTSRPFTYKDLRVIAQDERVSPTFIGKVVCSGDTIPITENMTQWNALQAGTELLNHPSRPSDFRTLEGWTEGFIQRASA